MSQHTGSPRAPPTRLKGIPGSGSPSQPFRRSRSKRRGHLHLSATWHQYNPEIYQYRLSQGGRVQHRPGCPASQRCTVPARAANGETGCLSCPARTWASARAWPHAGMQSRKMSSKRKWKELSPKIKGGFRTRVTQPWDCPLVVPWPAQGAANRHIFQEGLKTSRWHLLLQPGPHYFLINISKKSINCDISNYILQEMIISLLLSAEVNNLMCVVGFALPISSTSPIIGNKKCKWLGCSRKPKAPFCTLGKSKRLISY